MSLIRLPVGESSKYRVAIMWGIGTLLLAKGIEAGLSSAAMQIGRGIRTKSSFGASNRSVRAMVLQSAVLPGRLPVIPQLDAR